MKGRINRTLTVILVVLMTVTLLGCGKSESAKGHSSNGREWIISCVDENGAPVEGVKLQVCSGNLCVALTTSEDGTAVYEGEKGTYEISVLKTPAGYEYEGSEMEAEFGDDVVIELTIVEIEETAEEEIPEEENIEEAEETVEEEDLTKYRTGEVIKFSTVDRDGDTFDDSIFADNKLTMINMWEPWCGPCVNEMSDLEKLYQEYKDKGFLILGVHEYEDDIDNVLKTTGVTYPILDTQDVFLSIINETGAYPSTIFVDSEGYVLGISEEEINNIIEEYAGYYQQDVEAYANGELDEYINDPDYSDYQDYFDVLDKALTDPSVLTEYARKEVETEFGKGYYVGSADYDTWKERIEAKLNQR